MALLALKYYSSWWLVAALCSICLIRFTWTCTIKFKSLNCEAHNRSGVEITACRIQAVTSKYNSLSLGIKLSKPVESVMVKVSFFKRANGWKPFLYNFKLDGCAFLKNRRQFKIADYFFGVIDKYTNVASLQCPINQDLWVKDFTIKNTTVRLSFPYGEYMMDVKFWSHNEYWGRVNGSIIYSEY